MSLCRKCEPGFSVDCPPCLVLFKMADKISMSQRALLEVMSQRYLKSAIYPSQCNVEKTTEMDCILWPVPAFGWASVINVYSTSQYKNVNLNLIYRGHALSCTNTKLSLTIHSSTPYIVHKKGTSLPFIVFCGLVENIKLTDYNQKLNRGST